MDSQLLAFYRDQLDALRGAAAVFGERHAEHARHLGLAGEGSDPQVERLIEAVAFLAARVERKLEDEEPEMIEAMLDVLAPHFAAPIPSMALAQASLVEGGSVARVARGTSLRLSDGRGDAGAVFRTARAIDVWPGELLKVELRGRPFGLPTELWGNAQSVLLLTFRMDAVPLRSDQTGCDLDLQFIKPHAAALTEMILSNAVGAAVLSGDHDAATTLISRERIRPLGLELDEALLPRPRGDSDASRLLTEFFALPAATQAARFAGIGAEFAAIAPDNNDGSYPVLLAIGFDTVNADLVRRLTPNHFALSVTPAINLSTRRAEPISVDRGRLEYPLTADARTPSTEIYRVNSVIGLRGGADRVVLAPFWQPTALGEAAPRTYWLARRASRRDGGEPVGMAISLCDSERRALDAPFRALLAEVLCFDGNLPVALYNRGAGISTEAQGVRLTLIEAPTRATACEVRSAAQWSFLAHSLFHRDPLAGDDLGASRFRRFLALHDRGSNLRVPDWIEGIDSVVSRGAVTRLRQDVRRGVVYGTDVFVGFDPAQYADGERFGFEQVLDRVIAQYTSTNTFTRLRSHLRHRVDQERVWTPRLGTGPLI